MVDMIRFCLKAFFGGCLGCLGALSVVVVLSLILGVTVGPPLLVGANELLKSVPDLFSQSFPQGFPPLSGTLPANQGFSTNKEPIPPFEVFLTKGDNPDVAHLTTFTQNESKQVNFWVSAPKGTSIRFELLMTIPEQGKVQFGPKFNTNSSGKPVNCGRFGDENPSIGSYTLEAIPDGSSNPAGKLKFTITE